MAARSPETVKFLLSSFLHETVQNTPQNETYGIIVTSDDGDGQSSAKHNLNRAISEGISPCLTQPKDRQAFYQRINTFKPMNWFAKPAWLSPPHCARYGWCNVDTDLLQCVSCRAFLSGKMPVSNDPDVYRLCCEQLQLSLKSSHNILCPWSSYPTPESYLSPHLSTHDEALMEACGRVSSLQELADMLPIITGAQAKDLGLTTTELKTLTEKLTQETIPVRTLSRHSQRDSESELSFHTALDPDDRQDSRDSFDITADQESPFTAVRDHNLSLGQTASIIAACGWTKRPGTTSQLHCTLCDRHVGLWSYHSYHSQAQPDSPSEEESEEEDTTATQPDQQPSHEGLRSESHSPSPIKVLSERDTELEHSLPHDENVEELSAEDLQQASFSGEEASMDELNGSFFHDKSSPDIHMEGSSGSPDTNGEKSTEEEFRFYVENRPDDLSDSGSTEDSSIEFGSAEFVGHNPKTPLETQFVDVDPQSETVFDQVKETLTELVDSVVEGHVGESETAGHRQLPVPLTNALSVEDKDVKSSTSSFPSFGDYLTEDNDAIDAELMLDDVGNQAGIEPNQLESEPVFPETTSMAPKEDVPSLSAPTDTANEQQALHETDAAKMLVDNPSFEVTEDDIQPPLAANLPLDNSEPSLQQTDISEIFVDNLPSEVSEHAETHNISTAIPANETGDSEQDLQETNTEGNLSTEPESEELLSVPVFNNPQNVNEEVVLDVESSPEVISPATPQSYNFDLDSDPSSQDSEKDPSNISDESNQIQNDPALEMVSDALKKNEIEQKEEGNSEHRESSDQSSVIGEESDNVEHVESQIGEASDQDGRSNEEDNLENVNSDDEDKDSSVVDAQDDGINTENITQTTSSEFVIAGQDLETDNTVLTNANKSGTDPDKTTENTTEGSPLIEPHDSLVDSGDHKRDEHTSTNLANVDTFDTDSCKITQNSDVQHPHEIGELCSDTSEVQKTDAGIVLDLKDDNNEIVETALPETESGMAQENASKEKSESADLVETSLEHLTDDGNLKRKLGQADFLDETAQQELSQEPRKKKRKPKAVRSFFCPVSEHRSWCPWVCMTQDLESTGHNDRLAGWRKLVNLLIVDKSKEASILVQVSKTTPTHNSLRSIRHILDQWTSQSSCVDQTTL